MKSKIIILVLLAQVFLSCSKNTNIEEGNDWLIKRAEKNLDLVLSKKKTFVINLDSIKNKIILSDSLINYNIEITKNTKFIANPTDILAFNDTLLVLDSNLNTLFICNKDGKIIQTKFRSGRGPGELNKPACITKNKNYFAIYDNNNNRIQFFDRKFKYLKSVNYAILPLGNNICLTENYLFLNSEHGVLPKRIKTYSLEKLDIREIAFIDTISNINDFIKNAIFFYDYRLCAKDKNGLVASLSFLPFSFVFNDIGNLEYTIRFIGEKVEMLKDTRDIGIKEKNRLYIRNFCNSVIYFKEKILFSFGDLLVVVDSKNPQKYSVIKLSKKIDGNLTYHDHNLYLASLQNSQIYKLKLPSDL